MVLKPMFQSTQQTIVNVVLAVANIHQMGDYLLEESDKWFAWVDGDFRSTQ